MNRLFLSFARFHFAVCQHFYERSKSAYWREARDDAMQEKDQLEKLVLAEHINRVSP